MGALSELRDSIGPPPDDQSTQPAASDAPASPLGNLRSVIDTGGTGITIRRAGEKKPDRAISTSEATGRGVAQGVTANFYDELRGLHEAGGAQPDEPMSIYSVLRGAAGKMSGDKEATRKYDEAVARERESNKQAEEQHPVASTLGNVAGSLALPVGGAAGATTMAGRAGAGALLGAAYGGLAGAGEGTDAGDRATRATTGALLGGAIGGVAAPVTEGVLQAGKAAIAPLAAIKRGIFNTDSEAAMRITGAIKKDVETDPAARNRMTPQEYADAKKNGDPVKLLDLGGETTKGVARSAANLSPEARQILNDTIDPRFEGQAGRVVGWLKDTFHYPDAYSQGRALDAEAKNINRPAYKKAYQDGDKEINSPEMERLMGSPAFVDAMRRASITGKDRAINDGLGAFNPGVTVENGLVKFNKGKNGVPTYPNLQFWDYTKRELDQAAKAADRSGESDASVYKGLARSLREELDKHVDSYKDAREGAMHFFNSENALEAGKNFVNSKKNNSEARDALAKMNPLQRQLFQDGFVSEYINKLRENGYRRDILNKISESPAATERLHIALGPQKANELEVKLRSEKLMDTARKAVQGNSTSVRQWVELGLAGGTSGVGLYNQDPKQIGYSMLATGLVAGKNHINQKLARRVAEMLTSDDPKLLVRGAQLVARNSKLMDGLRAFDKRLAAIGGEHSPNALISTGAVPSHADDNQPSR